MYKIKLLFEWGGGYLWCDNEEARNAFDVGQIEEVLPISSDLKNELEKLSEEHNGALDWDNPGGPSPWTRWQFQEFEEKAIKALEKVRKELGGEYEVRYK